MRVGFFWFGFFGLVSSYCCVSAVFCPLFGRFGIGFLVEICNPSITGIPILISLSVLLLCFRKVLAKQLAEL